MCSSVEGRISLLPETVEASLQVIITRVRPATSANGLCDSALGDLV